VLKVNGARVELRSVRGSRFQFYEGQNDSTLGTFGGEFGSARTFYASRWRSIHFIIASAELVQNVLSCSATILAEEVHRRLGLIVSKEQVGVFCEVDNLLRFVHCGNQAFVEDI